MVKDVWQEIAPGVRSCYRNGVLNIEFYGIVEGIRQSKLDGVSVPDNYFAPDADIRDNAPDMSLVMRDALYTNQQGVVVGLSFYAKPDQTDKFKHLTVTETKLDLEYELALHRGEKLPLNAQQAAEALMSIVDGRATIEELTAENRAIYEGKTTRVLN